MLRDKLFTTSNFTKISNEIKMMEIINKNIKFKINSIFHTRRRKHIQNMVKINDREEKR